jgi:hypothetical protein
MITAWQDRVEASPEQLASAMAVAEKLSEGGQTKVRVIGWYHSHPHITVLPSHVDVRTQGSYQMLDEGFIGIILSTFNQVLNTYLSLLSLPHVLHVLDCYVILVQKQKCWQQSIHPYRQGSLSGHISKIYALRRVHWRILVVKCCLCGVQDNADCTQQVQVTAFQSVQQTQHALSPTNSYGVDSPMAKALAASAAGKNPHHAAVAIWPAL